MIRIIRVVIESIEIDFKLDGCRRIMLRVEIVDQRRAVAKQHAEDYILPYPYAFALKRTGCGTISQVGVIVFGT